MTEETENLEESKDETKDESTQGDTSKLKDEIEELEKKKAGLEEDVKRNLSKVVETRKDKRSLISAEEIDTKAKDRSPLGDPEAVEDIKTLKNEMSELKAGIALQAKTGELEALDEIYKKFPDVSPENDPDGTLFQMVRNALKDRLKVRRGWTKEALVADFEDAYILVNKDKVFAEAKLAGRREAEGDAVSGDIGGTSTSSSIGEDEITLTVEEREHALKLFGNMPADEAEKMYLAGKKRRLGI